MSQNDLDRWQSDLIFEQRQWMLAIQQFMFYVGDGKPGVIWPEMTDSTSGFRTSKTNIISRDRISYAYVREYIVFLFRFGWSDTASWHRKESILYQFPGSKLKWMQTRNKLCTWTVLIVYFVNKSAKNRECTHTRWKYTAVLTTSRNLDCK